MSAEERERNQVDWTPGPATTVSEEDIQNRATQLIAQPDAGASLDTGDHDTAAAFRAAKSTLEQTYTTATVMHFQLEPVNALAFEKDGVFEVHAGNQWQTLILPTLAKALGRPETSIVMRSYMLYTLPAALAAKALGRPVKMVLPRADDTRFDSVPSPSVQTLRMAFGEGGRVTAMGHNAAAGWPTEVLAPSFMTKSVGGAPVIPFPVPARIIGTTSALRRSA